MVGLVMRLLRIKLSGFKTFVDPTVIAVDTPFVAIVGPNGCGKSNVIDAVRWVLGETRASSMRAQSMTEVIFNGSSGRKPSARASVELLFDPENDPRLGAWARYETLSVKRVVERHGESSYFLNGQRVRRRDVLDLFLGTGLGPRAYAIIEQGMVSRLIEAKPEELRHLLEEAAGVTRYRERRKETEARLAETEAHLARLEERLTALAESEAHLKSEAETARRWRELTAQRERCERLLLAVRFRRAEEALTLRRAAEEEGAAALTAWQETHRRLTEAYANAQRAYRAATEALDASQARFYEAQAHLVDLRHRAQEAQLREQALSNERTTLQAERARWQSEAVRLAGEWETCRERLAELAARKEAFDETWERVQERFAASDRALQGKRQIAERLVRERHDLDKALTQVRFHRERAEKDRQKMVAQIAQLEKEFAQPPEEAVDAAQLRSDEEEVNKRIAEIARPLAEVEATLATLERAQREADAALARWREQRAEAAGRIEMLERNLARSARPPSSAQEPLLPQLWQEIRVAAEDSVAVAVALAHWMKSIPGAEKWQSAPTPSGCAVRRQPLPAPSAPDSLSAPDGVVPLLSRIEATTPELKEWLAGALAHLWVCDTASAEIDAWVLATGATVITRDGLQITPWGWVPREANEKGESVALIEMQAELDTWQAQRVAIDEALSRAEHEAAQLAEAIRAKRAEWSQRQEERELWLTRAKELARAIAQAQTQQKWAEKWQQERRERWATLQAEKERWEEEIALRGEEEEGIRERLALVDESLESAQIAVREAEQAWQAAQRALRELEQERQAIQYEQQQLERHEALLAQALARAQEEQERLGQRLESLLRTANDAEPGPQPEEIAHAAHLLDEAERALRAAREEVAICEDRLRQSETALRTHEQQHETLQNTWQQAHDARVEEEANLRRWQERLNECAADLDALLVQVPYLDERKLEREIATLTQTIDTLGPVNHAAFAALETVVAELATLRTQCADIATAAETLRAAIRTIDRETREALQSTFAAVNRAFAARFAQLFGGGHAELLLTGEEILDAGARIIAQPPGKKNGTIQILSGGEKALTAIALVFAFFDLNPAPFCILDEVDAPLDDANTERYAHLIRAMADKTQFLVITHNKVTMAAADRLIGITMREQGVSKVVDVDIERAVQLDSLTT